MNIGITGGAGFIGSNLALKLLSRGHKVSIFDDLSTGTLENLDDHNFVVHKNSILDLQALDDFAKSLDCVVHLAARGSVPRSVLTPLETFEVNVNGTLNVVETCRKFNLPLIFSSSSSVYGANDKLPKNELDWLSPLSPYAASKLAGEAILQSWARSYSMNVLIFRFFNVFGPKQSPEGQYAAVIPKWILNLSQNKSIEIFGNGNQTRDFTPVQTVVEVLVKSIESRFSYPMPINLAYGTSTSLNSLVEILKTFFPELECKFSKIRTSDILDSKSDGILINKLFPEIAPLDFKQAIIETIEYSRNLSLKN